MSGYYLGWNNKCYTLHTSDLSFSDASDDCQTEYGGNLASIPNQYVQDFIEDIPGKTGRTWIGGQYVNDAWTWLDGTTFNFNHNDDTDDPDDDSETALYIMHNGDDEWEDDDPSEEHDYICQF